MTSESRPGTDASPARGGLGAGGAALFAGTMSANVLAYGFFVVLSRYLTGDDLGAVGSLVNLFLIGIVPALGLQLVAARTVARAHHAADESELATVDGRMIRMGIEVGVGAAVLLAVLSPVVAVLLHIDVAPVLVLATALAFATMTYAVQGILQGEEKFGALSLVYAATGVTRLGGAVVAVVLGQGVLGVMVCFSVGYLLTAVLALALLPRHRRAPGPRTSAAHGREVLAAAVSTSGLFVLSSMDVLLARHHLSLDQSGAYTVGALFEKAGFWGPAFLATLFYPRMAVPATRRRAVTMAVAVTGAVGAAGVLVTVVLGTPLVRLVGGTPYASLGDEVWLFAALGACMALVQVLIYAGLAVSDNRLGIATWVAVATGVVGVGFWHGSIAAVVGTVLLCAAVLVVVGLVLTARPRQRRRSNGEAGISWTQRMRHRSTRSH